MAMSCVLAVTACLLFNGVSIPRDDVIKISDTCDLLEQLPPSSFEGGHGYGIAAGETIEAAGVKLDWTLPGARRKASWLRTCANFESVADTSAAWSKS